MNGISISREVLAQPEQSAEPVEFEHFKEWMVREMPPMTTIGNPAWWAKRIYDRFIYTTPPKAQPEQTDNGITLDLLETLRATLTKAGYATPEGGLETFAALLPRQLYNLCQAVDELLARNLALAQPERSNAPVYQQLPVADHEKPFANCKYRICDLPGQCKGEGKCHHPAQPVQPNFIPPITPPKAAQEPVGYQQLFDAISAAVKTPYKGAVGISVSAFEKALGSKVYTTPPKRQQLPRADTKEANDAISAMLAKYNHPANPQNAGRAGWQAAWEYLAAHKIGEQK